MIRRPVAQVAPLLLIPSYLSMDQNYRQAISNVEQADQLVNSATSPSDIELGKEKVITAQKNLDQLPVWFLGYEPILLCQYMSCSWHFTFDEFQAARMKIGRMQAKVFQESNAITQLKNAQSQVEIAKTAYQQATTATQRQVALTNWQNGLDQLTQIPPNTLANRMSQPQINAYQRDFSKFSGQIAGIQQTGTMIEVAKQFAQQANKMIEKPPYPVSNWRSAQALQKEAIDRLEKVDTRDPGYLEAQTLLAQYKSNLGQIEIKGLAI